MAERQDTAVTEGKACGAACDRNQGALSDQLAHQPPATAADRQPQGDLARSHRGSTREQPSDIGARDKQDGHGETDQDDGERGRRTEVGHARVHLSSEQETASHVGSRVFLRQRAGNGFDLLSGLRDGGFRLQSPDHSERSNVALLEEIGLRSDVERRQHRQRHVEGGRQEVIGAGESIRRNADHGEHCAGEADLTADNARIGIELLRPGLVCEDHDRITAGDAIFFRHERTSECRSNAKDIEEVRADCEAVSAPCRFVTPQSNAGTHAARGGKALEAPCAVAKVGVVRV